MKSRAASVRNRGQLESWGHRFGMTVRRACSMASILPAPALVAMSVSPTIRPSVLYYRGFACCPRLLFHDASHALLDYSVYDGGPVANRVLDLNTGRQVARVPDSEGNWMEEACSADDSALVSTDWREIKLWKRVGPDDPWA